jgi:hypothetical protein
MLERNAEPKVDSLHLTLHRVGNLAVSVMLEHCAKTAKHTRLVDMLAVMMRDCLIEVEWDGSPGMVTGRHSGTSRRHH